MSVQERVEAIENISDVLRVKAFELSELDTSALDISEDVVKMAVDAIEEALSKWIPQVVLLMTASVEDDEVPLQVDSTEDHEEADDAAIDIQHQRRTQKKRKNSDHEDEEYSGREEEQNRRPNNQSRNRFLKNHFGAKYDHVFKHHDAIMNGDERHMKKLLSSLKATHDRFAGGSSTSGGTHGRRTEFEAEGIDDKFEQCKRLAKCASQMSRYDQLVYYHSDDIDPATGEIDNNVVRFDEENLIDKFEGIANLTRTIQNIFANETLDGAKNVMDSLCDELLQRFHRTVEFDSTPQWQGALVDQVCLAEGTTVYVDLASIFTKLDPILPDFTFTGGFVETTLEPFYTAPSDSPVDSLADFVANELFECAKDLFKFNKLDVGDTHYKDEEFVFQEHSQCWSGCHPEETFKGNFSFYDAIRMPTSIDLESRSRDVHGQLLNNLDPGFKFDNFLGSSFFFDETPLIKTGSVRKTHVCAFWACLSSYTAGGYEALKASSPACENIFAEHGPDAGQCMCTSGDECLSSVNQAITNECQNECRLEIKEEYYNKITTGFELVFGKRPSVGFICGVKEAVVNDGKKLPGYCCLDAPYQLNNSNWGNAVSLEFEGDSY
jgi:hypothetical protein